MHDVARPVSNRPMQSQAPPKRRRKPVVIALALLIAICAFVFGIKFLQIGKMMSMPQTMPPTTVSSVSVKEEDWAPRLTAVGSVSAVQGAVVSAELAGVVSEINFENGAEAKKGEVLMKLDASQEEALLRSAEADAQLGKTDLERARDLGRDVARGAVRFSLGVGNTQREVHDFLQVLAKTVRRLRNMTAMAV